MKYPHLFTLILFMFILGAITAFFTNPFWVVKTRMCATDRTDPGAYKGLFGKKIIIPS
jgi:hypothetical protein